MEHGSSILRIVLIHPDIPQNTGNIARLCVGLEAELHLVHPMAFQIDDRQVKRAGLDYWPHLKLFQHDHFATFWQMVDPGRVFFVETGGAKLYTEARYQPGDWLIFGSEAKGLPKEITEPHADKIVSIPMPGKVRSLNLSNAAAVVAYEAHRQIQSIGYL